ncbi:hypothetical protein RB195_011511 [Necator americanus]|uniref:Uncharacterized protein n=1 Tax=Necator americanus TaxID=51031 RepID=A0ABR1D2T5_NECAM
MKHVTPYKTYTKWFATSKNGDYSLDDSERSTRLLEEDIDELRYAVKAYTIARDCEDCQHPETQLMRNLRAFELARKKSVFICLSKGSFLKITTQEKGSPSSVVLGEGNEQVGGSLLNGDDDFDIQAC